MSKLITLGCSFSEGMGCYDIELYNSYNISDYTKLPTTYHENIKEFVLNNSIGRYLQNIFGFSEYHNYAHASSSNQTQFLKFFKDLPKGNDITILWQITYYDRKSIIDESYFCDTHGNMGNSWLDSYYSNLLENFNGDIDKIKNAERLELNLYVNVLNEFCKVNGWNFYIWFFDYGETSKFINQFPNSLEYTIPFHNKKLNEFESYVDITGDFHPNQHGYKSIAESLADCIIKNCKNFTAPNEIPTKVVDKTSKELPTHGIFSPKSIF